MWFSDRERIYKVSVIKNGAVRDVVKFDKTYLIIEKLYSWFMAIVFFGSVLKIFNIIKFGIKKAD